MAKTPMVKQSLRRPEATKSAEWRRDGDTPKRRRIVEMTMV